MTQAIAAREIKLQDLKAKIGLQQVQEEAFCPEQLNDRPELLSPIEVAEASNKAFILDNYPEE